MKAPEGWDINVKTRGDGRRDYSITAPNGDKLRSKKELNRYLGKHHPDITIEQFSFDDTSEPAIDPAMDELKKQFRKELSELEARLSGKIQTLIDENVAIKEQEYNEIYKKIYEAVKTDISAMTKAFETRLDRVDKFLVQSNENSESLRMSLDRMEQNKNETSVLIFGLQEGNDKDKVCRKLNEYLGTSLTGDSVRRLHLLREQPNKAPRPVVLELKDRETKFTLFNNKRKLKGTGITIVEKLTKWRHDLYRLAREKYKNSAWTVDGEIYILRDGKRERITSVSKL